MSRNKYKDQIWVLPEDDANRQIALGFELEASVKPRSIHVLPVAGGWTHVRDSFQSEYNRSLVANPLCRMVLLVDFDGRGTERVEEVLSGVDARLKDRVYVLGARDEPEGLRAALGKKLEQIGRALAEECSNGTRIIWQHALLTHNQDELARMLPHVRPILFD